MSEEAVANETAGAATATAEAPEINVPEGLRLYEAMWLVDANLARENIGKVMSDLKELVKKSGGEWVNGDKWEERRLAYPVKKKKRALFVLAHFISDPQNLIKLERNTKLSDLVLRALVTKDEDGVGLTLPGRSILDTDTEERSSHGDHGGNDRQGGGYDRQGGGHDRQGGGHDRQGGGHSRSGGGGGRRFRDSK